MQEQHRETIQFNDQLARIREQQKNQCQKNMSKFEFYENFYQDKINDFLDEFATVISNHQNNMHSKRQEIIQLHQLFIEVKQDQKMLKEALRVSSESSLMNKQFLQACEKFSFSTKEQIKQRLERIRSFQNMKLQQGKKSKTMFYKKGLQTAIDKQKLQLCIMIPKEEKRNSKQNTQKTQYYFKYNKNLDRLQLISNGSKQLNNLLGQFNCNRNFRQFYESLKYYTEQICQNKNYN